MLESENQLYVPNLCTEFEVYLAVSKPQTREREPSSYSRIRVVSLRFDELD